MTLVCNALIERLHDNERIRFINLCERVLLTRTESLFSPDGSIDHVYFPVDGFVCLMAQEPPDAELIIAMIGREGMLDPRAVLGIEKTPVRALVQSEGWAWRMPVLVFQHQLNASATLKHLMDRYVAVMLNQAAALALCLRFHEVDARLARWLLMSQDRTGSDQCRITQESLGTMLGVRRVSITSAAYMLQRRGAIRYHRGNIQLLDRAILKEVACNCYHADRKSYSDLLP